MFDMFKSAPTLDQFATDYLNRIRATNRSARDDAARYRKWIAPVMGTLRIDKVTPKHCADMLRRVSDSRAPATANRVRALLRRMLTVACADGHLTENPARWLQHQREPAPRDIVFTDTEFEALLAASRQWDFWPVAALFQLCLLTGRRAGEWRTITRDRVDIERRCVSFPHTKSGRAQTLALNDDVLAVLGSVPASCRSVHGPDCQCAWLLPGARRGEPIKRYSYAWARVCETAGMEPVVLHGTRHNMATQLMARSNLSDGAIALMLGHQSINTTRRYLHARPEVMQRAAQEAMRALRATTSATT